MADSESIMRADHDPVENEQRLRRTIRRTAIILGVVAFAWYFGFMALRLL